MNRLNVEDTTDIGGIDFVAEVIDPYKFSTLGFTDIEIDITRSGVKIVSGILPQGYTKQMLNDDSNILRYMMPSYIRM